MRDLIIIGALTAIGTGIGIGIQTTALTRVGSMIDPIRGGLMTTLIGGVGSLLIVLALILWQGSGVWQMPPLALVLAGFVGITGIIILMGISFSYARIGVTAGVAGLIMGQLLISVVVDAFGWGVTTPIPLDVRRIVGLVAMAGAVWLLLPQSNG